MHKMLRVLAAAVAVLVLLSNVAFAQADDFPPITQEVLDNPPDGDWVHYRRTNDEWGHSPLDQINRENVHQLQLAWSRALRPGTNEMVPLVYNGIMYIPHPQSVVEAVDATTGDLIWSYTRPMPEGVNPSGTMRGLALYGTNLYYAARDGFVVALDARTGEVVWETQVHDPSQANHSSGPFIADGKVIAGRSCGTPGVPGGCYTVALDAESGEELWRVYTIARPGEPGGDTWGGLPLESRYHVSTWNPGSYDPELGLIYIGTAVPGPYPSIVHGREGGDALYSNSTLAIDVDTGEMVWYYQHLPGDDWDMDHPFERILVDTTINPADEVPWKNPNIDPNEVRKVVWAAGKAGTQFVLDRETGEFLWARPLVHQNVILDISPEGDVTVDRSLAHQEIGDTVILGPRAGKDWWVGTYSPRTGAVYQPLLNAWLEQTSTEWTGSGQAAIRTTIRSPVDGDFPGRIGAYLVSTGELLWEYKQPAPILGGLVSTEGGLIFGGDTVRRFRAWDDETGDILWETILNARVSGGAISYEANGCQYIAVSTGGGTVYEAMNLNPDAPLESPVGSPTVFAFALPECASSVR